MFSDMVKCKTCGTEVARGTSRCPECGGLVRAAAKMMTCKSCGAHIAYNAQRCPKCGTRVFHIALGLTVGACCLIFVVFTWIYPSISRGNQSRPSPVTVLASASPVPTSSLPAESSESLTFGPGTYTVGKDIDAGTYDCIAVSGFGVLRGDVASHGAAGFVQTMGDASASIGGVSASVESAESYSNLELADGDIIYIEMNLKVEFVPK